MDKLPRHFINGSPGDSIPVLDRGLRYGDGCFETMAVRNGRIPLWHRHYQRLVDSLYRLKIEPGFSMEELEKELAALIADTQQAVLRLTITRGSGAGGYAIDHTVPATRIASLLPDRQHPESYVTEGVQVRLCRTPLSRNPLLAGIKHLNRLEQVLARDEWQDDYAEGLMCDDRGYVIEGTITNMFIVADGKVITPALDQCGVAGVMRAEVLDRLDSLGIDCVESEIQPEQLLAADECFLTNAVIGIWPVASIDQQRYKIGETTRNLVRELKGILG